MSDAVKMVLTISDVTGKPWNKPGSQQYWYTVATEELGEPVKFVQDKSKGAPSPIAGETYQGNMYEGNKFYAFKEQPVTNAENNPTGAPPDFHSAPVKDTKYQRDITSIPLDVWRTLIGIQGVPENPSQFTIFFQTVQTHANELLDMIETVRGGSLGAVPTPSPTIKEVSSPLVRPATDKSLGAQFRARNVEDGMTAGEPDVPEDLFDA